MLVRLTNTKSFAALVYSWQVGAHHIGLIVEAVEGRQRSIYWHKFVDWLSKMVHVTCYPHSWGAGCNRTCKALQRLDPAVACMPDSVMSDRGHPQFNNLCWKEVNNVKSMRRLFSTFRPQTYGRIENKPHYGGNIVGVCATRSDRLGWALGMCKVAQKLLEPMTMPLIPKLWRTLFHTSELT